MVITNGAGRVAEVAARFTLDAMPGKQMSIDADLNAGTIDEATARSRRKAIEQEADFYGAMDGASKFVKGDAIAGIIIILVNIVGGLAIGVIQLGIPITQALQTYTLLTVGDDAQRAPFTLTHTDAGWRVNAPEGATLVSLPAQHREKLLEGQCQDECRRKETNQKAELELPQELGSIPSTRSGGPAFLASREPSETRAGAAGRERTRLDWDEAP